MKVSHSMGVDARSIVLNSVEISQGALSKRVVESQKVVLRERFLTQINRTVLSLNMHRIYFSSSSKIKVLLVIAHSIRACFGIH